VTIFHFHFTISSLVFIYFNMDEIHFSFLWIMTHIHRYFDCTQKNRQTTTEDKEHNGAPEIQTRSSAQHFAAEESQKGSNISPRFTVSGARYQFCC
jgi:hypothetical protein